MGRGVEYDREIVPGTLGARLRRDCEYLFYS
jgi:hypothetical protein